MFREYGGILEGGIGLGLWPHLPHTSTIATETAPTIFVHLQMGKRRYSLNILLGMTLLQLQECLPCKRQAA